MTVDNIYAGLNPSDMKTVKLGDWRGYAMLETDVRDGEGRPLLIIPGLKDDPTWSPMTDLEECKDFIDRQLEWRHARLADKETFVTEIVNRGGSLTITVSKQATKMGLRAKDRVKVTLELPDERGDARPNLFQSI